MAHSGKALVDPYIVFKKIQLGQGMRVADLGCGRTGHFVFSSSRVVGEKGVVFAVEIVQETLQSIKSRVRSEGYDNVQTIWADIERVGTVPVPEKTLDACFLVNVLFMVRDKAAALTEAVRLLKPGGFLVVVEWTRKIGTVGPREEQLVSKQMIDGWTAGLPVGPVDIFPVGEYHYCALYKKNI